jgi:hypothetical protein
MKLNLGCGSNKIPEFVNIDSQPGCNPDLVLDFINEDLPYADNTIQEVVMFHTIEHIRKPIWRVLEKDGILILSYPEFTKCYENWFTNKRGRRDFWEATIYGRQAYPSDFHVCIINTPDLINTLSQSGFNSFDWCPESNEDYNTILTCRKKTNIVTYADWLNAETSRFSIS